MPTLDETIAQHLAQAAASGELKAAPSWGQPLPEMEGWEATPEALRMPFKILKDAGFAPPEVGMFHERARLRAQAASSCDADERARLERELVDLEQKLALRLESLRIHSML
jgi:hypothetical protein